MCIGTAKEARQFKNIVNSKYGFDLKSAIAAGKQIDFKSYTKSSIEF